MEVTHCGIFFPGRRDQPLLVSFPKDAGKGGKSKLPKFPSGTRDISIVSLSRHTGIISIPFS